MATAGEDEPGLCQVSRKVLVAVSILELAIILILVTGMSYLATHQEQGQQEVERWTTDAHLATVDNMNWTLQVTRENWQACQNYTRRLAANSSALHSEVSQLSTRLHRQELENKVLQGELAVLRNWTQKLEDLNNHQKEIIAHFQQQQQQQQKGLSDSSHFHSGPPFLVLPAAIMVLLLV